MTDAFRRPLILLVDDDAGVREMYAECLRSAGFDPLPVASPIKALRIATTFPPDVIVTEIVFPGAMSGIELIRRLRRHSRSRHVAVICLSGLAFGRERKKAERAGCSLFLVKPRLPDDLVRGIECVLAPVRSNEHTASDAKIK